MNLVTANHNHIIFHHFPFGISWTLMISPDAELSQLRQQVFFFLKSSCVGLHAPALMSAGHIFYLKAVFSTVHYWAVNSLLSQRLKIGIISLKPSCIHQIRPVTRIRLQAGNAQDKWTPVVFPTVKGKRQRRCMRCNKQALVSRNNWKSVIIVDYVINAAAILWHNWH